MFALATGPRSRAHGQRLAPLSLVLSAAVASVGFAGQAHAAVSYTPSQISTVYGFTGANFKGTAATGAGQTIAIIDWYNDPNIVSEVAAFNSQYGLQTFNSGGPTFTVVNQSGGSSLPTTNTTSLETALDVQWAHAMAPQANIILVEPNTSAFSDTDAAVNYVKAQPGVSVVSMSYGATDTNGNANFSQYDSTFTQAAGHAGVTFCASTGDSSSPSYPATSPHVLAVGGTTLSITGGGTRSSEVVWNNSRSSAEGTGYSANESEPAFQLGVQSSGKRSVPDVAYDADPNSGVYVEYNSGGGNQLYSGVGGTSISSPQWAAIIAIADQGRALNGLSSLTSDQALTMLYALVGTPLYSQAFYDVTSGTSNGQTATTGWDVASGLGTPNVGFLVNYLAGNVSIPEPSQAGVLLAVPAMMLRRRRRA
jgi:subtilase family serine protease